MGLQWTTNLAHTLNLFNYYLKKNGVLIFSVPNSNNFPELKVQYKNIMLDNKNVKSLLYSTNFLLKTYEGFSYKMNFPNTYEAIKSIKYTGANCMVNNRLTSRTITKNYINNFFVNPTISSLTYVIDIYICEAKKS